MKLRATEKREPRINLEREAVLETGRTQSYKINKQLQHTHQFYKETKTISMKIRPSLHIKNLLKDSTTATTDQRIKEPKNKPQWANTKKRPWTRKKRAKPSNHIRQLTTDMSTKEIIDLINNI